MAHFVYVLKSLSTGRFYIGQTANLNRRIAQHNNDRARFSKNRGPWELVHTEEFPTRPEACRRERTIKKMKSHAWIEQVVRASR